MDLGLGQILMALQVYWSSQKPDVQSRLTKQPMEVRAHWGGLGVRGIHHSHFWASDQHWPEYEAQAEQLTLVQERCRPDPENSQGNQFKFRVTCKIQEVSTIRITFLGLEWGTWETCGGQPEYHGSLGAQNGQWGPLCVPPRTWSKKQIVGEIL